MSLAYDPLGRLRQTTAGSATTQFLYDGDRLVAEYNASGTLLRRYVHGPGVDEPVVWYEGSGLADARHLMADERGSIIAASGTSTTRHAYGPYGEPDTWTGPRFRYTGQAALTEVQLYHYKARVYDPVLGRFLQTDPIGYQDDLNLYGYVANDPMNRTDPTGMREIILTGSAANRARFVSVAAQATGLPLSESNGTLVSGSTAGMNVGIAGNTMLSAINSKSLISVNAVSNDPSVSLTRLRPALWMSPILPGSKPRMLNSVRQP